MKRILIYLFVLLGCKPITNSSIDGIYTCSYKNEFYKISDTLILRSVNKDVYQIDRRTAANKKRKNEKWTLIFDEEKKVLTEMKNGKTLIAMDGTLILGSKIYKKIKP